MTNFIPIFPLGIVVYPGEQVNLHIFEPRYKQLITECYAEAKPFGIPVVLEKGLSEMGTLVTITGIAAMYEDGKMDIHTKGLQVFRTLELIKSIPEKLYSGAIVNYPNNGETRQPKLMQRVLENIRELHRLLNIQKDFHKPDEELTSYDVAHHAGLSLEEEYELLGLFHEIHRLEYLKQHLSKVLPVMTGMEALKKRIQLNGHFKELKGFNFDR
ncbi:MAG: LON peptidase substrate-binding domain-containing protein [Bacteroidetes bacterium]|nr:LON peptidase substrate-binding domain-containing protein [Bacteroidota bacterium]